MRKFFFEILATLTICNSFAADHADTIQFIRMNQLGFKPHQQKIAVVSCSTDSFLVFDATRKQIAYKGMLSIPEFWPYSNEWVRIADFSSLQQSGTYQLVISGFAAPLPTFEISENVYTELSKASAKAFYFNRASIPLTTNFAGEWARAEGHPDTSVLVHASASSPSRPEGFKISAPGGWYDAGDYNKYIVNSAITLHTLLSFYELFSEYCKTTSLNIPESNDNIPDIVNEVLWNLRWMLCMQDPADGGVYHKLTNNNFDAFVMPEKAVDKRYVVQKNTAASLDFVATMAKASRVLSTLETELPGLNDSCRLAALAAWNWCLANPAITYKQPSDILTGEYGDNNLTDEWYWAATELYLLTENQEILAKANEYKGNFNTPSWNEVATLGIISSSILKESNNSVGKEILIQLSDSLIAEYNRSAYRVSINEFAWGSNSDVAYQGMLLAIAFKLTQNQSYLTAASASLDYLLGKNATGYCFVTGFGYKSPLFIHHRPSGADGIVKPVPGFLAGGPNTVQLNDCIPANTRSLLPAVSYDDSECSYSTNEIAINWNAPLVFLSGSMDALMK